MLSTLRIRNIGVIDEAVLDFGPGFTALTGETGAGKTMIVTGLTMLLGSRLDTARTGLAASVDGTIALAGHEDLSAALDELGAEEEDGEVLVARRVTRDGRSRAKIGGAAVPIGTLARLVGSAVTVHGQSDQQRLREPEAQREALDRFGSLEIGPLLSRHQESWKQRARLGARVQELESLLTRREERGAVLTDALERLEAVDPQPGEDEALRRELDRLAHASALREATETAALALVGDDDAPAAGPLLDIAAQSLRRAADTDPGLRPLGDRLEAVRLEVSDLAAELSRATEDLDTSPGRVEEANQRLHELTRLVRDLGPVLAPGEDPPEDVAGVLESSRQAAADLDRFAGAESDLAAVRGELAVLEEQLEATAAALTLARTAAAQELSAAVEAELRHLEMPDAALRIEVDAQEPRAHGRDAVTIQLAPHPGARPRPVAQAASGGELSRVMLALEVALASTRRDASATPVFVFDEIDAGIGGRAALAVGQRLARLAVHAQVIVVTHLPQVAAHASTHLQIVKTTREGATSSSVQPLDGTERVHELARMLAGDTSARALAHAEELLEEAGSADPAPAQRRRG